MQTRAYGCVSIVGFTMSIEELIRDYVSDIVTVEDSGIGWYAYGDGHYNDIRLDLSLTNDHVVVEYKSKRGKDFDIPTYTKGVVWGGEEGGLELEYLAYLDSVAFENNIWQLTYLIEEDI